MFSLSCTAENTTKKYLGTFRCWKTWTESLKCPCFPGLFTSISICKQLGEIRVRSKVQSTRRRSCTWHLLGSAGSGQPQASAHGGCTHSDSHAVPPCYIYTFIMLDEDHAVLYGGQTEDRSINDAFIPQWVCDHELVLHPILFCVELYNSSRVKADLELKCLAMVLPDSVLSSKTDITTKNIWALFNTGRCWLITLRYVSLHSRFRIFTSHSICNLRRERKVQSTRRRSCKCHLLSSAGSDQPQASA